MEGAQQALIDAHHGPGIVELAAVVWCTKKCDQLSLREEFVAVLNDLMRPADEIHVMFLQEPGHNIGSEGE